MPVVLVKGGATAGGQRAAASHTGALASDDRVFDGMCRQAGAIRAATIEEAFEAAATFATQPLPRGQPRRGAHHRRRLGRGDRRRDHPLVASSCSPLPDDLRAAIDEKLPPRWSRNNPIDLAGAETRDTIPEVLDLVTAHPDVDAVVDARPRASSRTRPASCAAARFYPDHGLERIVAYHERQDARFAHGGGRGLRAHTASRCSSPPSSRSPTPTTPGPRAVRESGRLCYLSADRAVRALEHLWRDARHRARRAAPRRA